MTVADYLIGEFEANNLMDMEYETNKFWESFFWDEYDNKKHSDTMDVD